MSGYPEVTRLKQVRLPHDGVHRCGSGCAHQACRHAGKVDGCLRGCDASGPVWSACPYRAIGFIYVEEAQNERSC
jgi:hypothetical protein